MEFLDSSSEHSFVADFRLIHFISSNMAIQSPIPFREKLNRAFSVSQMMDDGSIRREFRDGMRRRQISDLIMVVSTRAQTPDDLRFWLKSMETASESLKRKVFSAFDRKPESYSIMIGHVWQRLGASSKPDWNECLRVFQAVREFGDQNSNQWLAAAAVRAS